MLDERRIGYAIVARLTQPIQRRLPGLRFHPFRERWESAEFRYQPHGWPAPARFVVVRRPLPDDPIERAQLTPRLMQKGNVIPAKAGIRSSGQAGG